MRVMDMLFKNGTPDNRPDSNYNIGELTMGREVEKEHTECPIKASIIAKDHLDEIPDYYTRLKVMEDEAKKSNSEKPSIDLHFDSIEEFIKHQE